MARTTAAPVDGSRRTHTHAHLWSLPDGTGLHAPYGQLVIESGTGRVCCHLCGRWYVSLGGHLRAHGHTADSYRETMGLCRSRPLIAEALSRSIAARQGEAYRRSPELPARLAIGQELSKAGLLATLAHRTRAARWSRTSLARSWSYITPNTTLPTPSTCVTSIPEPGHRADSRSAARPHPGQCRAPRSRLR